LQYELFEFLVFYTKRRWILKPDIENINICHHELKPYIRLRQISLVLRIMRRFSITDKLIIASLLISVVTIIIVASYSFYKAKKVLLDRSFHQLNSVRVIKTNLIEKFFSDCQKEVFLAKSSMDVKQLTQWIDGNSGNAMLNSTRQDTQFIKSPFISELSKDYYSRIYIIGRNHKVFFIKPNNKLKPVDSMAIAHLWQQITKTDSVFIQDYSIDSHSNQNLNLSAFIRDELHKVIGIIVFDIKPQAIDRIMLNEDQENGLGKSGETYLVGPDYLMRSSSRFQDSSVLRTRVQTLAVDSAFANLSGTRVIKDYRGVDVLSSYARIHIPNLNWVLLSEIDYKEVLKPVFRTRNEIVIVSIFIFTIVLLVVIILSKRITRPIQKLISAAHKVGQGDLDVKIQNKLNDEIGELIDTFNQMVEQLKAQAHDLELEKQKSLKSLFDGQEVERQRLSRELHDSLGQFLIGLKLKYESCLSKPMKQSEEFQSMGVLFDQTIEEARRISNNLMPAALSEFGLTTAVRNICNSISDIADVDIQFTSKGSGKDLNIEVEIYIFRIIQEALTNILKHAQAKNAWVSIGFEKERIFVVIGDDGKGFDKNTTISANSNGLNNIKDRVLLLNGELIVNSVIGKGSSLEISIPK